MLQIKENEITPKLNIPHYREFPHFFRNTDHSTNGTFNDDLKTFIIPTAVCIICSEENSFLYFFFRAPQKMKNRE